jgi:uncharacterized repeat protein (TIGR03803 family)
LINIKGTLYGTTYEGGASGYGTVFSITTAGEEHVLYSFGGGSDGAYPEAGLIAVRGTIYGTTHEGGGSRCFRYGCGTVYSITMSGQEKVLHSFASSTYADGTGPCAGLIDMAGKLYGTTETGGTNDDGVVFSIATSGAENVLYSFRGGDDGSYPRSGLLVVKGALYGTTITGGPYYGGVIFSVTTGGQENVLYRFGANQQDAAAPYGGLIDVTGTMYGTSAHGGASDLGAVFSVTLTGEESVLYSFSGGHGGSYPDDSLLNVNGTLYGTTVDGGGGQLCRNAGCGTVFALAP